MDIASFREHFARIPRHVAVLAIKEKDSIFGVTISSLQSVSIDESKQILSFVLKKNSSFSEKLTKEGRLSVNFLGIEQTELGRMYSSNNREELTTQLVDVWGESQSGFAYIIGAPMSISGTLIDTLEMQNSKIHFVSADEILKTDKSEMLLYSGRFYGYFKACDS
jgi:flavin reductase (DIM6/NTAB) family NADH-FMN oxidoreductase RutF